MTMRAVRALVVAIPVLALALLPSASAAAAFVVNSTGDAADAQPGDGFCLTAAEVCTLRAAIEEANFDPDPDQIGFSIGSGGAVTIQPQSALPAITNPVVIDGTTQPGFAGTPIVELDGTSAGTGYVNGLYITGPANTIKGLVVNRFNAEGILVEGPAAVDNTFDGNYVGTDITGTLDRGNGATGIYIRYASANLVENNLLSGNHGWTGTDACGNSGFCGGGFMGTLSTGATGNVIRNNRIGTDVSGSVALPNSQRGIELDGAASNLVENNIVAANALYGIGMLGSEAITNVVTGNRVGVGVLGTELLGNGSHGIVVAGGAHDNEIRDGNIVANNRDRGIVVDGAGSTGNRIRANSIYSNVGPGIATTNGGNIELPPPEVSSVGSGSVSGTACAGCAVDVFSDQADEGQSFHGSATADGSGSWTVEAFVTGPNVTATATDTAGNTSAFSSAAAVPALTGLAVTVGEATIGAGTKIVPLKDIPIEAIPAFQGLVSSTPLGSIGIQDSPLGSIPLGSIPLGSIDIDGVPIGSIPLSSVPLGSIAGGWEALLDSPGCQALPQCAALGDNPAQALTLQDILALSPLPPEIAALTLGDVGLSQTSLRGLSLASLLIGSAPLGSIPLGSIPLGSIPLGSIDVWGNPLGSIPLGSIDPPGAPADMCAFLAGFPGFTCADLGVTNADTLVDLFNAILATGSSLASSPLGSIFMDSLPLGSIDLTQVPLGSLPLGSIPLGSIPLNSLPLGSIPLGSIPLGSIPLGSIPLGSIPLGSIPLGSIGVNSTPLGSIPLGSIPVPGSSDYCAFAAADPLFSCAALGIDTTDSLADLVAAIIAAGGTLSSSPLGSIPLGSIPIGSIPLGSIPLGSIPLGSIPLGSIALSSLAVQGNPLGSIPLGSIDPPGTPTDMCAFLAGFPGFTCAELGLVNAAATLSELFTAVLGTGSSLSASPLGSIFMDSLPLGSIDLLAVPLGSIPLGSIPLGSILLSQVDIGATPIGSVPLGSIDLPNDFSGFCAYAQSFGAQFGCSALGVTEDSTIQQYLSALTANGLTLAASPLGSIPLGSIPLGSIPLGSITIGSVPPDGVRIGGVPLGSILLSGMTMAATPLGSILLSDIPNVALVVNCSLVNCATGTLADAATAGAISPSATIADLGAAASSFTVADVLAGLGASVEDVKLTLSFFYGAGLLGDAGLDFGNLTLGQILIALLIESDFAWEDLPLDEMGVQRFAGTGQALHYHVSLANTGGLTADGTVVDVVLPGGFIYVPGSARATGTISGTSHLDDPAIDLGTNLHHWAVDILAGESLQIDFAVLPGLDLGTFTVSAGASHSVGGSLAVSNQAPTTVGEHFENDNDAPSTAPLIAPDTLVVSHISSATDQDFYRIAVPAPGSRVSVFLSHLSNDDDLVMYRPGTAPISAAPTRAAPLGSIPLEDQGLDLENGGEPLPPETLQDINLQALPLGSISANRANEDELVSTSTRSESGDYTIQVAGYNGQLSDEPYVLRVKVSPPPPAPQCSPRTFQFPGQGVAGSVPGSIAADRKSLILVNYDRFGDTYGAAALSDLQNALNNPAFLEHPNVMGVIIPVEGQQAVADAYAAWDANPCSPALANAVVFAITGLIGQLTDPNNDGVLDVDPDHIALIGSDEIIPFARIPDVTALSNESDYVPDMLLTAPGNNAIFGSLFTENVLSDNPYGDVDPIDWLGRQLFVPDRAVGRVVETPSEIVGAINKFVEFNGNLDPRTLDPGRSPGDARRSLTTGYDFLADGATTVDAIFHAITGGNNQALINETWTAGDLESAMNPANGFAPDLVSANAHYDHFRALPADQNALKVQKDLFTTADVETFPAERLQGRVLLTMGCHSALNIDDVIVGAPTADQQTRLLDWPQEYARQKAVYAGNTGYGYGDTRAVALSERLMVLMSQRLDGTMSVGQALAFAKQAYFGDMGVYGVYDEKVLAEATYYGLPMYTVGAAELPVPPAPPPLSTDPVTGLQSASITTTPAFELVQSAFGDHYEVQGQLPQVSHYRPIEPRTQVDVTQQGIVAMGALITGLASVDEPNFDVAFARPVIDLTENEPAPEFGNVAFPSVLQNVSTFNTPGGARQSLVLMPGQFFHAPDGTPIQRRFTQMTATVYYSNSDDFTLPAIHSIDGSVIGSTAAFAVDASASVGAVIRVLVTYRDQSGAWKSIDLQRTASTNRWTGGATIVGSQLEYFVQALKNTGAVATSSNKGTYFEAAPPPPPPAGITTSVTGPQGSNGWFTGSAEVTISGDPGVIIEVSTDGAPFAQQSGAFAVTGDGIHTVLYRASDGSAGSLVVPIDQSPPTITIVQPPDGATVAVGAAVHYFCGDAGSGIASCTGTLADGDPLPVGTSSLTVFAEDLAGNTASLTHTFTVQYRFFGFFDPVDNPPVFNLVKAGQGVPLKWRLLDASGGLITDLSTVDSTTSSRINCVSGAISDVLETTATGQSGLRYDRVNQQFIYSWQTAKSWARTCRKLVLTLADGTEHIAYFRFT